MKAKGVKHVLPKRNGNRTPTRSSKAEPMFRERVYDVVRQIPRGSVLTYKEVAQQAGSPNAYRAVGTVLASNYDPAIPCHRVVRSDGVAGGYNRGAKKKTALLKKEGAFI